MGSPFRGRGSYFILYTSAGRKAVLSAVLSRVAGVYSIRRKCPPCFFGESVVFRRKSVCFGCILQSSSQHSHEFFGGQGVLRKTSSYTPGGGECRERFLHIYPRHGMPRKTSPYTHSQRYRVGITPDPSAGDTVRLRGISLELERICDASVDARRRILLIAGNTCVSAKQGSGQTGGTDAAIAGTFTAGPGSGSSAGGMSLKDCKGDKGFPIVRAGRTLPEAGPDCGRAQPLDRKQKKEQNAPGADDAYSTASPAYRGVILSKNKVKN